MSMLAFRSSCAAQAPLHTVQVVMPDIPDHQITPSPTVIYSRQVERKELFARSV